MTNDFFEIRIVRRYRNNSWTANKYLKSFLTLASQTKVVSQSSLQLPWPYCPWIPLKFIIGVSCTNSQVCEMECLIQLVGVGSKWLEPFIRMTYLPLLRHFSLTHKTNQDFILFICKKYVWEAPCVHKGSDFLWISQNENQFVLLLFLFFYKRWCCHICI